MQNQVDDAMKTAEEEEEGEKQNLNQYKNQTDSMSESGEVGGSGGLVVNSRVKGPWSPEEDVVLSELVSKFGARNWSLIARGIPGRSGKSCRLRWCNQLDPCLKRKPFTGNPNPFSFSVSNYVCAFVFGVWGFVRFKGFCFFLGGDRVIGCFDSIVVIWGLVWCVCCLFLVNVAGNLNFI